MVDYNLKHLTQPDDQNVGGPIQDDEALFLFAMIRVMRLRRVLEIGGLGGYSARNFLAAVGQEGHVYSVDLNPVPILASNHTAITKDATLVGPSDVDDQPLDLVFFDCHVWEAQTTMFQNLREASIITDTTVLSFHDTNLHPFKSVSWAYSIGSGWVHQMVERQMVNHLHRMGYDVLVLDTKMSDHGPPLPLRHGLAVARLFKPLPV
jgi:hypothetical protein